MFEGKNNEKIALLKDEIHLWYGCIDQAKKHIYVFKQMMANNEMKRARNFYFTEDRSSFIVSRGILRTILACYVSIDPINIQINYGKHGKPFLDSIGTKSNIQFNLSHSKNILVIAISLGQSVGVDIEKIRKLADLDMLVATICSQHEKDQFKKLPDTEKLLSFFRCWTRKEAYIKAIGTGLHTPLDQLTVPLTSKDHGQAFTIYNEELQGYSEVILKPISAVTGYEIALCVNKIPRKINYYWWQPSLLENNYIQ